PRLSATPLPPLGPDVTVAPAREVQPTGPSPAPTAGDARSTETTVRPKVKIAARQRIRIATSAVSPAEEPRWYPATMRVISADAEGGARGDPDHDGDQDGHQVQAGHRGDAGSGDRRRAALPRGHRLRRGRLRRRRRLRLLRHPRLRDHPPPGERGGRERHGLAAPLLRPPDPAPAAALGGSAR